MERYIFKQAEPVWAAGLQNEMNIRMGFYAQAGKGKTSVNLACSTAYQIYVNDTFAAAGPARAARGYYRVDEIDINLLYIGFYREFMIYSTGRKGMSFNEKNKT
jgi:hypothetical protein